MLSGAGTFVNGAVESGVREAAEECGAVGDEGRVRGDGLSLMLWNATADNRR
jgi:hypothetical protein